MLSKSNITKRIELDLEYSTNDSRWNDYKDSWGPKIYRFPKMNWGEDNRNAIEYISMGFLNICKEKNIKYRHHHHPKYLCKNKGPDFNGYGIDCSNMIAYLYNLTFGVVFSGNVRHQSIMIDKKITSYESCQVGDVVFFYGRDGKSITHVGIKVGDGIIHSTGLKSSADNRDGPQITKEKFKWPITKFAWAIDMEDIISNRDSLFLTTNKKVQDNSI